MITALVAHCAHGTSRIVRLARSPARLVFAYVLTVGFALARHPMWLDELQAWCVARDAQSLRELLWNMRYDGHPALWYLCLFTVTRITQNPVFMQILHLCIATATVALIAWRSPFSTVEKWLLAFGYLFAFEYAVISRGYALGVLLVVAACHWLSSNPRERVWPIALALCALANTSVYGTVIAICLMAAFARDWLSRPAGLAAPYTLVAAAATVAIGCVVAIATMKPPADYAFAREWHMRITAERLVDTSNQIWFGWAPLPDVSNAAPWNTSLLPTHRGRPRASALLALAAATTIFVTAWSLRKTRLAMDFYVSATLALLLFIYLKYSAGPRHSGHLFVILVAALWLSRNRSRARNAPMNIAFWSAAALQVVSAAFFLIKSAYVPFSWSEDLVRYVRQLPATTPVVVADVTLVNYVGPVLSAYLERKIDYIGPSGVRHGSFMILDEAHHGEALPRSIRPILRRYVRTSGKPWIALVTSQWHHADRIGPAVAVFGDHLVAVEGVATVRVIRLDKETLESRTPDGTDPPSLRVVSCCPP